MLENIKVLLGLSSNDKDALLTILIQNATEEAMVFTHNECLEDLETAIQNMVVFQYNRLGTEGVDSESYSGVRFDYSADYPENIMRMLKAKRKAVFR